jgi:hypothetical protein
MNLYEPCRSHPFSLEGEGQDEGADKSTPYLCPVTLTLTLTLSQRARGFMGQQ